MSPIFGKNAQNNAAVLITKWDELVPSKVKKLEAEGGIVFELNKVGAKYIKWSSEADICEN